MYKTDNGYLVCEDTKEGFLTDFKLEGRTIVNKIQAWTTKDFINSNIPNNFTLSKNNTLMIKNFTTGGESYIRYNGINFTNYRDRTFTFICDISANVDTTIALIGEGGKLKYTGLSNGKGNRSVCVKFKVSDLTISENTDIYLRFDHDTVNGGDVLFKNCMLLEGDHTQNPPNGYFEGLKSAGQDVDKLVVSSIKGDGNLFDGVLTFGTYDAISGIANTANSFVRSKEFIRVSQNTNYVIKNNSRDIRIWIYYYTNDKQYIGCKAVNTPTFTTFTTPSNCYHIGFVCSTMNVATTSDVIQLNKGTTPILYRPIESDKKEILYYDPADNTWKKPILRGKWENDVMVFGDTVEEHADGSYYHKRMEEDVLDGSEKYEISSESTDTILRVMYNNVGMKGNRSLLISDRFNLKTTYNIDGKEGIFTSVGGSTVFFDILKTKATDLATFKTWLFTNNVTITYPLEEEQIYECNVVVLDAYDNETILLIESGSVSPNVEFDTVDGLVDVVSVVDNLATGLESVKARFVQKLTYKGIEASENDNLLNLVEKIEDLANINIEYGFDIPIIVKNDTIFIKTNKIGNVYLSKAMPTLNENDVYISISDSATIGSIPFKIKNGNKQTNMYVNFVKQKIDNIVKNCDAYICVNDKWVQFSYKTYVLFNLYESKYALNHIDGWYAETNMYSSINGFKIDNIKGIAVEVSRGESWGPVRGSFSTYSSIDMTNYSKLIVNVPHLKKGEIDKFANFDILIKESWTYSSETVAKTSYSIGETIDAQYLGEIDVDISNIQGSKHICITISGGAGLEFEIDSVELL